MRVTWSLLPSARHATAAVAVGVLVAAGLAVGPTAGPAAAVPPGGGVETKFCGEAGGQDPAVAAIPGQVKCRYTNKSSDGIGGKADYFTVPDDTHTLQVALYGGYKGGVTTALLAVEPGQVLQVNVGGQGESGGTGDHHLGHRPRGGWNGGGDGGTDGFGCHINYCGEGGHGAVDIRTGSYGLADRVLVAGGAGGDAGLPGGYGGGARGTDGVSDGTFADQGGGGSQTQGGRGGGNGAGGGSGQGGTGGDAVPTLGTQATGGGGGGGGYFGGGGGGGRQYAVCCVIGSKASGAGGSGYAGAGTYNAVLTDGSKVDRYEEADVSIRSIPDDYPTSLSLTSGPNPSVDRQAVTFTATVTVPDVRFPLGGGTVTLYDANLGGAITAPVPITPLAGFVGTATATFDVPLRTGERRVYADYSGYSVDTYEHRYTDARSVTAGLLTQVVLGAQTLSFASSPGPRGVDGETYRPLARSTSGLPVTLTVDPAAADVCVLAAGLVSFLAEGTCTLNADQAGSSTVAPAVRVQQTFTVGPHIDVVPQVVTFTSTPSPDLRRGEIYTVAAVGGGSGTPVTITADERFGACFLAGPNQVRMTAGGQCLVTASQAGAYGFLPGSATQLVQLSALSQVATFRTTAPAAAQVGDTYELEVTVDSGRVAQFTGTAACSVDAKRRTSATETSTFATVTAIRNGPCVIQAQERTDDGNYLPSNTITQSYFVGTEQTVTFTSTPPTDARIGGYGTFATDAGGGSGLPVVVRSTTPRVCSLQSTGTISYLTAGTCTLVADQAGNATYAAAQATQSYVVGRRTQEVMFSSTPPANAIPGGTYRPSGYSTGSSFGIVLGASGACTIASRVVTFTAVGTCTVTGDVDASPEYDAAPQKTQVIRVREPQQTIDFTSPADVTFGVADFDLDATASSGLPVTYSTPSTSVCTVSGRTVHVVAVGTCSLLAEQPGDDDHEAAVPRGGFFTIRTADQAIAFTSAAPTAASVGGSYSPRATGGGSGNAVTFDVDAASTPGACVIGSAQVVVFTGPGTCVVDADQAAGPNHHAAPQVQQQIAVATTAQTIRFLSTPPSPTLAGSQYLPTLVGGDSDRPVTVGVTAESATVCTVAPDHTVSFTQDGTCTVVADQAGNAGYTPAATVTQVVTVGRLAQAITFTSTPSGPVRVGGGYTVTATGGASGRPVVFAARPISVAVCQVTPAGAVSFLSPGRCFVDARQRSSTSYAAAPLATQLVAVIKGTQTVAFTSTPPNPARVGDTYPVTVTGGASPNPVVVGVRTGSGAVCSLAAGVVTFLGAGACVLDARQAGSTSYDAAPTATQVVTVTRASQAIVFTSTPPNPARVGDTYAVTATGGASGQPVVVTVRAGASAICRVAADGEVTFLDAGRCLLDARQAGSTSSTAAPTVTQTIVVVRTG